MASTIKIKRSETAGNPSILGSGELAYSALPASSSNGGDRLYIGVGTEIEGNAVNHVVIGGKYFTDLLDHTPGVLTPLSAILVDENGAVDSIKVGSLLLNTNTVSSTGFNEDLILSGSGTGKVRIGSAFTLPTVAGSSGYVLTSDGNGSTSWEQAASSLTITTDNGSDTLDLLSDNLNIQGLNGVTSSFDQNTNTLSISGINASYANKGIAQFIVEEFEVTSGVVALKHEAIRGIVSGLVSGASSQDGITVSYNGTTSKLDFAVPTTTLQVTGAVTGTSTVNSAHDISLVTTIADGSITNQKLDNSSITVGTTEISLGAASTTLIGLTEVGVGEITLSDNVIEVTTANQSLALKANGTGTISASNFRVSDVAIPTSPYDAANKLYVDSAIQGVTWKNSVNLLADSNVALTGSTGTLVIDGHPALTAANDGYRILLKNQTNTLELGIYTYSDNGTTYTLSRSADANTVEELRSASVFVSEGTNYVATGWVQSNHYSVAFSDQEWVQFSAASRIIEGNGIIIDGNTVSVSLAVSGGLEFSGSDLRIDSTIAGAGLTYTNGVLNLVGTADRVTVGENSVDIASTYEGQSSIITLGTVTTGTWNADILTTAYGGTGLSTISVGDLLLGAADNAYTKLAIGTSGKILQSNGTTLVYSDLDGGTY